MKKKIHNGEPTHHTDTTRISLLCSFPYNYNYNIIYQIRKRKNLQGQQAIEIDRGAVDTTSALDSCSERGGVIRFQSG